MPPQLGLTSPTSTHNPQLFTHHKTTQLGTFRPRIGGLVAATQLDVKGARVLVLEKYVIPGGSSGFYKRDGYTFDVGSSVMFGFSDKVSLITTIFLFLTQCILYINNAI
ncbi:hypothetical protein ACSBR2_020540 [Camellia fascicularis]